MLQKNDMVRKALGYLHTGVCDIIEHQKVLKPNKTTGFADVVVIHNQPCRLSFKTVQSANQGENGASLTQTVTLFLPPDIPVKAGSKIVVTQNGKTAEYKSSGEPAVHSNHQEIILELFTGWA